MSLLQRHAVTAETLKRWQGREFAWGTADCARLAACHLRRAGHQPPLNRSGQWRTALGAARALQRAGFANLADALDAVPLLRIAPAAAMQGDIVALPSEDRFEALGIVLGNGRVLSWIGGDAAPGCAVLQPVQPPAMAWRVLFEMGAGA